MEAMTRRERKKQQTRQEMLRSAKHLFREKGYENTSVEDVTERADVSKSTLFKHFPNKESLLIGLAEDEVKDLLTLMECSAYKEANLDGKVQVIMSRLIEDSIPYLRLTGQILFTTLINKNNIESPFKRLRDEVENLIKQGQEQGYYAKDLAPESIVIMLFGSYYGVLFKWFEDGGEAGVAQEMEVCVNMILDSIKRK